MNYTKIKLHSKEILKMCKRALFYLTKDVRKKPGTYNFVYKWNSELGDHNYSLILRDRYFMKPSEVKQHLFETFMLFEDSDFEVWYKIGKGVDLHEIYG